MSRLMTGTYLPRAGIAHFAGQSYRMSFSPAYSAATLQTLEITEQPSPAKSSRVLDASCNLTSAVRWLFNSSLSSCRSTMEALFPICSAIFLSLAPLADVPQDEGRIAIPPYPAAVSILATISDLIVEYSSRLQLIANTWPHSSKQLLRSLRHTASGS